MPLRAQTFHAAAQIWQVRSGDIKLVSADTTFRRHLVGGEHDPAAVLDYWWVSLEGANSNFVACNIPIPIGVEIDARYGTISRLRGVMTTLMRNGRDRRSENPLWADAIVERVFLVGTDQRITSGPAATAAASRQR